MTTTSNITQHPAQSDEERRRQLKSKIEAGEQRHSERNFGDYAREAADTATGFAKRHPLATVAGAVAVGLAIGAMTRPGRRLGRKGGAMAALAADTVIAYGLRFLDEAGDRFGDLGDAVSTQGKRLGRTASTRADQAGDTLRSVTRGASTRTRDVARDLRSRFTH